MTARDDLFELRDTLNTEARELMVTKNVGYTGQESGEHDPVSNFRKAGADVGIEAWRAVMMRKFEKMHRAVQLMSTLNSQDPAHVEQIKEEFRDDMNFPALALHAWLTRWEPARGASVPDQEGAG
jgi:hypothetical protein